ncbi:unnamed protein product [Microthlaspi erraticum]|uniref:Pectinesterase inhibitor domain-containing protein n=1 Tax=Microthlaspi erraticum TaxID=1685480 RepID=A0A6D2I251_9BRAS|nr:unnamed protein product [Microthlaspi erraticum]
MAILSPFLLVSASALTSTKYIDAICGGNPFCMQTLTSYPPAVSATDLFSLAQIVINLGMSYAEGAGRFAAETAEKEPTLTQFKSCQREYDGIQMNLRMGKSELKEYPDGANYDIMRCIDSTVVVRDLIGGNSDNASKTLMEMTRQMQRLINVAVGATVALGG